MRTTLTLDEDVAARLRALARERGLSFKAVVNTTLRTGLGKEQESARPFHQKTYSMRLRPGINLDKALQLASALEDDETLRKLELRK